MALSVAVTAFAAMAVPHNEQPKLVPPQGLWRGSTLEGRYGWVTEFELDYGVPLHLYRGFKPQSGDPTFDEDELAFIRNGGIYFYSLQAHPWSAWGSGDKDNKINAIASAIAAVAPAQVMIAPGFEPDGHASEMGSGKDIYGTYAEYVTMYRRIRTKFDVANVTNAVFVLDFSAGIHKRADAMTKLFPGPGMVDWVFFNMFQKKPAKKDGGNCTQISLQNYAAFEEAGIFNDIPWGIGAWGTRNSTYGTPPEPIPTADRAECLEGMRALLGASGPGGASMPRIRAATYFNSLACIISPRNIPGGSTELAPQLSDLLHAPTFTVNDGRPVNAH